MSEPGRNERCPCGSGKKYKACCANLPGAAQVSLDELFNLAQNHHQQGRQREAEALYKSILARNSAHAGSWHYLGVLAQQSGRFGAAAEFMKRSIELDPKNASYHCNLGCALQQQGKAQDAVAVLEVAGAMDEQSAEARYNLGLALKDLDRPDEAIASYRRALRLNDRYPEAHAALGAALSIKGESEAASASLRRAVQLRPGYAEAHFNLGNHLARHNQIEEAIASLRAATSARSDYAEAHSNLGNLLRSDGRLNEAIPHYREAVKLSPAQPEFRINLIIALTEQGEPAEAIAVGNESLAMMPGIPELQFNFGNALHIIGDLDAAMGAYGCAIELRPEYAEAYGNRARALQEQGRMAEAIADYEKALAINPGYTIAFSNLIYLHAFAHDISPQEQLQLAAKWEYAALPEEERAIARTRNFPSVPWKGRKIRLGIVSAELGQHAVAEFLQPVLERLDRTRFHLALYPTVDRKDERAQQFQTLADEYVPLVRLGDEAAAARIRNDAIDVLIDTSGHTAHNRLGIFARRAAPVQCTWIGYWATTGLSQMDWYIHDGAAPPEFDADYRERLWRLGRSGNIYRGDPTLPASSWKPAEDGTVWLGSFNKYAKIREECLALWAKALDAVPHSHLLLEDRTPFDDQIHPRIRAELQKHGIAPERVEFSAYEPGWRSHMLLYNRLDIALDTMPFNSGTTAYDALWMGVPLVALEGDWGGGRMASVALREMGRPEWVARDAEEYAAIVANLARDTELRRAIRETQRARMSAGNLCDASGMASDLESAIEGMWDEWAARQMAK